MTGSAGKLRLSGLVGTRRNSLDNQKYAWILMKNKTVYISWSNTFILRSFGKQYGEQGSGRIFSGFGIWTKYGAGIGKTINILMESGIWLFSGQRELPKIGHEMQDLCLRVCQECWKSSQPSSYSGQSVQDVGFSWKRGGIRSCPSRPSWTTQL